MFELFYYFIKDDKLFMIHSYHMNITILNLIYEITIPERHLSFLLFISKQLDNKMAIVIVHLNF